MDDNSHDFLLVHHNVIYNIHSPFYASTGIVLHLAGSHNNQVYNNTIWNVQSENRDYDGGIQADGDSNVKVYNNLMNAPINGANAGTDMQNNLSTSNPGFVDAANSDFHLQAGSPVIDQGRVIAGITDGFVGSAPDIGAYEYGGADWTAGAKSHHELPPRVEMATAISTHPQPPSLQSPKELWRSLESALLRTGTPPQNQM